MPRELSQLGELVFGVHALSQHGDDEPALQRGVRLAVGHGRLCRERQNPLVAPVQLSPVLAATGTYPFVRLEQAKRAAGSRRASSWSTSAWATRASRPTR